MKRCITLVAAILLLTPVLAVEWKEVENIQSCEDNSTVSFCADCFTVAYCSSNGTEDFSTNCILGSEACYQGATLAFCTDSEAIPECECPSDIPSSNPDPYNDENYFLCLDHSGVPIPMECDSGQFNEDIQGCEIVDTTISPYDVTTVACAEDTNEYIALGCFSYQICINGDPYPYDCKEGEIYDDTNNECVLYVPFTCTNHLVNGIYPDSSNCTIFHTCVDGIEPNDPTSCPEGYVFDTEDLYCGPEGTAVCTLNGCQVPIPGGLECDNTSQRYPINENSYYQCTESNDGSFELIPTQCPDGFFYDDENGYCEEEE